MAKYTPQKIEKKWQQYWEKENSFATADRSKKPKYYCLVEFPYPSGDGLHVGHPRPYTALDILARKRRMQGYNVLYPMGFDAFGLPTENYAIKTGQQPADITKKNIVTFTQQLKSLGLSFDWQRQVVTSDPTYYRWTQWIFLKLFEHGLAYKDTIAINWCPSCKIGLANEEVVNGNCERCGTAVEKRQKAQWLLKITLYADRLIQDLSLVAYDDRIKLQQVNWIGRSEGAQVDFAIDGLDKKITVYTTRPDTLFGATFMVLSPEHQLIAEITTPAQRAAVETYQAQAASKTDLERTNVNQQKTGVFTGAYATNPLTGKKVPIWIADYVLSLYGTGAIMAVPAHDQRDWEFATKFKLPIVPVISGGDISKAAHEDITSGKLINSQQFNGLSVAQGNLEIIRYLIEHQLGKKAVNYKLRDWVFSRQRYWGEPIPLVYCESCAKKLKTKNSKLKTKEYSQGELLNPGWVAVPEKKLPVTLPAVTKYEPTESGESPLSATTDWVDTTCPRCKGAAKRETDTMPNWAGSNWYFLRYIDPKNAKAFADKKKLAHWLPVDWYNGGMEHTTLHLLYSRFIYKFLYDIDVVPKERGVEPYAKRTSHGLILGEGGEKMSKSKGNVINPNDIVGTYGADTLRLYEMFMGPFDQAIPWDTKGVKGVRRFLEKVWDVYERDKGQETRGKSEQPEITTLLHKTIKKVSEDIETQDYNTAVSAMMIFINAVNQHGGMSKKTAEAFLKILAPFAPHLAEELWQQLGHRQSIAKESWPVFDASLIATESITLVIQVNGKVRDSLTVPADITEQMAESMVRQREKIQPHLQNKKIQNVIFVPGRLINFVTE